jgi:hypothetical protein
MNRIATISPLLVIAALVAASPAGAATPPKIETALFKAEIKGVQHSSWTMDHDSLPGEPCGARFAGVGNETFSFRSKRPVRLKATRIAGNVTFTVGRGIAEFPVKATVDRNGHITVTQHSNMPCGTGNGEATPAKPDCRTRKFDLTLGLYSVWGAVPRLNLRDATTVQPLDYKNCPTSAPSYEEPLVLNHSKLLAAKWPADEIFDRSIGKEIIIGKGRDEQSSMGTVWSASMRWVLTVTRIR